MKTVEIAVVHKRPGYPENVDFIRVYHAEANPKIDFEAIFKEAFTQAHPTWPIQKVKVRNQE